MSVFAVCVIVVAVGAAGAGVALFARTRAPEGSWIRDSDRGAGIYSVLGASFAILLGFVVLFAATSYGDAKRNAENEATAVHDLYDTSTLFPAAATVEVRADLLCYARAVVNLEWPRLADAKSSPVVDVWAGRLSRAAALLPVNTMREEAGFTRWLQAATERDQNRRERLLEARHTVPPGLWVALLVGTLLVLTFLVLWADPLENAFVQALAGGGVTALIFAALLATYFLDAPFGDTPGGIRPLAMKATIDLIEDERSNDLPLSLPCDARGRITRPA